MSQLNRLGEIYHDPNFEFNDGNSGNKLIIILGRCCSADNFIVVRTTSKSDRKSWDYGCHNDEPDPNFFIPLNLGVFPLDTWICLDYLTNLDVQAFDDGIKNNQRVKKGEVPREILKNILDCASRSQDISNYQSKILRDVLAQLA